MNCKWNYLTGIFLIGLFYHVQTEKTDISFRENVDCRTLGEFYHNGTDWLPSSKKNCVKCTCLNGLIDCDIIDCAIERINCSFEKQARGECCNRCMKKRRNNKRSKRIKRACNSKKRKNRRRGGKRRRKNKDIKGRKKSRRRQRKNRIETTSSSPVNKITPSVGPLGLSSLPNIFKSSPTNPLTFEYFKRLCMPDDTDKVIYRHYKKHHGIYIAFDDLVSSHVEVLWWNIGKGKLSPMQIYKYPADDFRQNITEEDILGATSNRQINTFKRRLRRQMDICLKKNKCRSKVIKRAFFCFGIEKVTLGCKDSTT